MTPKQDIKIVFNMKYAVKMQLLGHKMLQKLPNPKDERYYCWVFQDDDTFDSDLHKIIVEGRRNE